MSCWDSRTSRTRRGKKHLGLKGNQMDLVFLAVSIAFFAATIALVIGFERLRKS